MAEPSLLESLRNAAKSLSPEVWAGLAAGAAALVVAAILWRVLAGRKPRRQPAVADLTIPLSALEQQGPPAEGESLEFYNIPVRVAAVILAPVGRVRDLPPEDELPQVFDALVPGLDRIVQLHRPLVRRWPNQPSVRGFARMLFTHVRLPGEGGKGTPWSSVAGIFKLQGQPLMAGLVLRAERPNSLGQTIVDREENWLACLRVRPRG